MVPGFEIVWQFDVGAVESGDLAVGAAGVADLDFAPADLHRRGCFQRGPLGGNPLPVDSRRRCLSAAGEGQLDPTTRERRILGTVGRIVTEMNDRALAVALPIRSEQRGLGRRWVRN